MKWSQVPWPHFDKVFITLMALICKHNSLYILLIYTQQESNRTEVQQDKITINMMNRHQLHNIEKWCFNFLFNKWFLTRQIWGIWKLRLAYSPETPNLGQNQWCFVPCDLEIWWMTLENNRAPLLCCFKLCATFHSHRWIQTGIAVRKRPIWVKFDDF